MDVKKIITETIKFIKWIFDDPDNWTDVFISTIVLQIVLFPLLFVELILWDKLVVMKFIYTISGSIFAIVVSVGAIVVGIPILKRIKENYLNSTKKSDGSK